MKALARVLDDPEMHVELRIGGEPLDIYTHQGRVRVRYASAMEPQAVISVPYEPLVAYADGRITQVAFGQYLTVDGDAAVAGRFLQRLARAKAVSPLGS